MLLASITAQAVTYVVVPPALAGTEGSLALGGILMDSSQTAQMRIPASALSGLVNGDSITGLQFRLSASQPSGPSVNYVFSNFDFTLSQPSASYSNAFNANFANNIGPNAALVRSGTFTFTAHSFPSVGSPTAFGPMIDFQTPYVYGGGDLLITMRLQSSSLSLTALVLDAENLAGSNTLYGAPYNGTNATTSAGYIPAMQLRIGLVEGEVPVATPEPSTFALALMGLGLVAFKLRG